MADSNPELTELLHRISQESNQILALCRARADQAIVKKQLATILDVIKKIIACVGPEAFVDDVKAAAVGLKDAIFQVFQIFFFFEEISFLIFGRGPEY